jgi:hypothetical protein
LPITDRIERYAAAGDIPGGTLVQLWTNPVTGSVENRTVTVTNPATSQPTQVTSALVSVNDSERDMPLNLLDSTTGNIRQTVTMPALSVFTRSAAQMAAVGISTRAQASAIELTNG